MLHDNYTQSIPFFKGVITKYFEEDESTGSYKAFIEMPVNEHRCPHCGNSTTYIKDYRLQTVRDLVVLGKPLIVTITDFILNRSLNPLDCSLLRLSLKDWEYL